MISIQDILDYGYIEYETGWIEAGCDKIFYKTVKRDDEKLFVIKTRYYEWNKQRIGDGHSFTFSGMMYDVDNIYHEVVLSISSIHENITIQDVEKKLINIHDKAGFSSDIWQET